MARKVGLGKGLDALIPGNVPATPSDGGAVDVPIEQIMPNPRQPRSTMDESELENLAASIREHGILQPLLISLDPQSGGYLLVAGERRLRAARLAGLDTVPVIIRQTSDQQRLELALIENVQRADLTPLETAEAFHHLIEEFGLTHEEVAQRVGKSREAVTNTHRLVRLPNEIKAGLAEGLISEGHARALLSLEDRPEAMIDVYKTILRNKFSVRQTEALVKQLAGPTRQHRASRKEVPAEVKGMEEDLRRYLGTRIQLHYRGGEGSLTIHYYSDEELNDIIAKILKE
jgi:ParB family chromosome partitioning protein